MSQRTYLCVITQAMLPLGAWKAFRLSTGPSSSSPSSSSVVVEVVELESVVVLDGVATVVVVWLITVVVSPSPQPASTTAASIVSKTSDRVAVMTAQSKDAAWARLRLPNDSGTSTR